MEPSTTQQEDTKKRVLSGTDFSDRENTGRDSQKDNALELKRIKALCGEDGVNTSCLAMADRCGKMIALEFSSSIGARAFEQKFKKIDFGGA